MATEPEILPFPYSHVSSILDQLDIARNTHRNSLNSESNNENKEKKGAIYGDLLYSFGRELNDLFNGFNTYQLKFKKGTTLIQYNPYNQNIDPNLLEINENELNQSLIILSATILTPKGEENIPSYFANVVPKLSNSSSRHDINFTVLYPINGKDTEYNVKFSQLENIENWGGGRRRKTKQSKKSRSKKSRSKKSRSKKSQLKRKTHRRR
jgi:hypothetical protein